MTRFYFSFKYFKKKKNSINTIINTLITIIVISVSLINGQFAHSPLNYDAIAMSS